MGYEILVIDEKERNVKRRICLTRYALWSILCVGRGMRWKGYAFELFESMVKVYGVCVCVLGMRCGVMRLLLAVVCVMVFNPRGDSFIKPLLPIIPYESVNFCLTFRVKYDKCGCSLDFLDSAFIICNMEPFRYVGIVYDSQWQGFCIYCLIIVWCDFLVKFDTVYAFTNGKHQ